MIWLEDWVWLLVTDGADELLDCEAIPGLECEPETLRRRLAEMGWRERPQRLRWVLLLESEPRGGAGEVDDLLHVKERGEVRGLALPEWLRRCWQRWPVQDWPACIEWGPDLVAGTLREREQQGRAADAVYCPMGERVVVIGGGNAAGFRRMGRGEKEGNRPAGIPGEDWLRQTAYLFHHYTGRSLQSLWCPEATCGEDTTLGGVCLQGADPEGPETARQPLVMEIPWLVRELGRPLRGGEAQVAGLLTERRKDARRRWSFLSAGIAVLFLSAFLLIAGACRGPGASVDGVEATPVLQLSENDRQTYKRLISREEALRMRRQRELRPFKLVGSIAGNLPRGVELRRIHLARTGPRGKTGGWKLRVNGRVQGDSPSPGFRSWLQELETKGTVKRMDSLRMEPGKGRSMRFTLAGQGDGERSGQ